MVQHLTDSDVLEMARTEWAVSPHSHHRRGAQAIAEGNYRLIHGRTDRDVYLVRMWVTVPRLDQDGDFESERSTLLHYFPRGDDDACLHDHPWDFITEILQGGYIEHLPPLEWKRGSMLGPAWNKVMLRRNRFSEIAHHATDLHCVGEVLPDTWTMVTTGARTRSWGFHPEGEPWVPWRQYIETKVAR